MDWTAEAIETLRGYWSEGHSTAEIGRRMGISKNAVVGKAHRLNLPARPSPIRRDATVAQAPRAASPAPATPVAQAVSAKAAAAPAASVPPMATPASASPVTARAPASPSASAAAPAPAQVGFQITAAPPPPVAAPVPARAAAPVPPRAAVAPPRKPTPVALPNAVVRAFPRSSTRSCCWPIGEPGTPGFRFCTADAMGTKPYCAEHAAVAYVKVRDRREDAA